MNGFSRWSSEAFAATEARRPGAVSASRTTTATSVTLTYSVADTGGVPILRYRIQWKSGAQNYSATRELTTTRTNATVSNLAPDVAFDFRVRAENSVGDGPWTSDIAATTTSSEPGRPGLSVSAGRTNVVLTASAPVSDGGRPITAYRWQWKSGNELYDAAREATTSDTTHEVTGLTPGREYTFRVRAENVKGGGEWSVERTATPMRVEPGKPGLSMAPGRASATATVSPPSDNGGAAVIDYLMQWKSGMQSFDAARQQTFTSSTTTVTGLTPATEYTFRVQARNAIGSGAWSDEETATPTADVPGTPTLVVTAGRRALSLAITAPASNGGAAITEYTYQWKSGNQEFTTGRQGTTETTSATISSLAVGTEYTVRVRAENSVGGGEWSDEETGTPINDVPTAPGLRATAGRRSVRVDITAPSDNGGAAVLDYTVEWKSGAQSYSSARRSTSTSTARNISGLTVGVVHTFRAKARNTRGDGPWSAERTATPTADVPGKASVSVTAGRRSLSLGMTAPSDTGGAAITGYTYQWKSGAQSYSGGRQSTTSSTSASITGLTVGTQYTVRARAENSVGSGQWSDEKTGTPTADVPGSPSLSLSDNFNAIAAVASPPGDTGGASITGYQFEWKTGSQAYASARRRTQAGPTYSITSLTPGTTYTVRVRATNSVGYGGWTERSVTLTALPTGPTNIRITHSANPVRDGFGRDRYSVSISFDTEPGVAYSGIFITSYREFIDGVWYDQASSTVEAFWPGGITFPIPPFSVQNFGIRDGTTVTVLIRPSIIVAGTRYYGAQVRSEGVLIP